MTRVCVCVCVCAQEHSCESEHRDGCAHGGVRDLPRMLERPIAVALFACEPSLQALRAACGKGEAQLAGTVILERLPISGVERCSKPRRHDLRIVAGAAAAADL
jgi:hypothetical protein